MNSREERGKQIATAGQIQKYRDTRWLVDSQSSNDRYCVDLAKIDEPNCSCPDFAVRHLPCKHIYAVAYFVVRKMNRDRSTTTVTGTLAVVKRKTYPQNWKAYNAAQTEEQDKFQVLLSDLCRKLPAIPPKPGRPPLPLSDAVFISTFKVYSTISQRRFMSDLRESHGRGYISKVPHFNSISNALENPSLTPILRALITESSLPLRSVETKFAVDSSGFCTSRFSRWFDVKYGKNVQKQEWVKVHLTTGVKTNVVTAVELGGKYSGDSPYLAPMIEATAENFQIAEVSADAAYCGERNAKAINKVGATPFIAFKTNAAGIGGGPHYRQMFHYFNYRREEFLQHFHLRSNVESTFSMIKRKFGDGLRSKTETAMLNETLCKILCHNIVVLIHEIHELGIAPEFWATLA